MLKRFHDIFRFSEDIRLQNSKFAACPRRHIFFANVSAKTKNSLSVLACSYGAQVFGLGSISFYVVVLSFSIEVRVRKVLNISVSARQN